jgi:hypothetical protein
MSATPGKVHILGRNTVDGMDVFMLQYLQCRRPELVRRPFFATFDPKATWFDQLHPARGSDAEFFPKNWPDQGARVGQGVPMSIEEAGVRVPLRIAVDES